MKLFVLISAVLLSSVQAVESVQPEDSLTTYVMYDTDIKDILTSSSSNCDSMNAEVSRLMSNLKQNITDLRTRYGIGKSEDYQHKYEAKSWEFKRNPQLPQSCKDYVEDIMKMNKYHQRILSNSIINALLYWKEGYDKIDNKIITARIILTNLEKSAHECGKLFNGREYAAASHCALQAYQAADTIRLHQQSTLKTSWGVEHELTDLRVRTDEILVKLYKDLAEVFRFYAAETIRDDWLNNNCA